MGSSDGFSSRNLWVQSRVIFFAILLVYEVTLKDGLSSSFFSSHTNRYSAIVLATCSHPVRCAIVLTRQYVVTSSVF